MMLEVHTVLVTDERPAAAFLYVLTDERFLSAGWTPMSLSSTWT
jgi:hypothetical protein